MCLKQELAFKMEVDVSVGVFWCLFVGFFSGFGYFAFFLLFGYKFVFHFQVLIWNLHIRQACLFFKKKKHTPQKPQQNPTKKNPKHAKHHGVLINKVSQHSHLVMCKVKCESSKRDAVNLSCCFSSMQHDAFDCLSPYLCSPVIDSKETVGMRGEVLRVCFLCLSILRVNTQLSGLLFWNFRLM